MIDKRAFWIWLQSGVGAGAATDALLAFCPSAEDFFALGVDEWKVSGVLTYTQIDRLKKADTGKAAAVVKQCDRNGWSIVTPDMRDYPRLLLKTRDFPLVLFVRGDISCVNDALPIAVVGSRSASLHSMSVASQLCESLSEAGVTVVSGCALGVDSAAHTGAIQGGGRTVAVLGCGINFPYLMQNEVLRREISKKGAVISEYPPETPVTRSSFPARNRIISGMCRGTVVIQAGDKSGSLITANRAAEQGRDIFAVPGDVTSADFTGVNKLIRDGARPVFSARDVLCEYAHLYPDIDISAAGGNFVFNGESKAAPFPLKRRTEREVPKPTAVKERRPFPDNIGGDAAKVYESLADGPLHIDEIIRKTEIGANMIFAALTELEIYGFIKLLEGKTYERQ